MEFDPITAVFVGTKDTYSELTINMMMIHFFIIPTITNHHIQHHQHQQQRQANIFLFSAILSIGATLVWQRHREQAKQKRIKRDYHKKVFKDR